MQRTRSGVLPSNSNHSKNNNNNNNNNYNNNKVEADSTSHWSPIIGLGQTLSLLLLELGNGRVCLCDAQIIEGNSKRSLTYSTSLQLHPHHSHVWLRLPSPPFLPLSTTRRPCTRLSALPWPAALLILLPTPVQRAHRASLRLCTAVD